MSAPKVLVVDDDPRLREVLRYTLDRAGFIVEEARDGKEALERFNNSAPDLLVLDVLMPEMDGLEVCRRIRQRSDLPIVFLSSRDEELDRVLGLELGGDDYITKPFSPRELVSRVKAVLRRARPTPRAPEEAEPEPIRAAGILLRPAEHRIFVGDTEVVMTVTEFNILQVLMSRPGRVRTRDELVDMAYEGPHHISDRTLDSHIRRIRQKLRDCGLDPIETVHGLGYRLRQD